MTLILSVAALKTLCDDALIVAEGLPPHFYEPYLLMSKGGFRFIEIFELSRWTEYDDDYYEIETAKGGNNRYYQINSVPDFYKECIRGGSPFYDWCRYSTFNRSFRRTFVNYPIMCETKNVTSHVFRYNVCKQLYLNGQTIAQISTYIGEADDRNTEGYVNSILTINN